MSEKQNKRSTTQKRAIEAVFNKINRPLSPDEILAEGRKEVASLNQATVYRNLKSLTEEGRITKVHIPPAGTLFEKSDKAHHHHFHCRVCQKSFEIHDCAFKNSKPSTPKGFVVEDHEIFYYGTCPDCSK